MKKVLISVFTLIFIISMITVVNAASGSVTATASSNQVTKGNTFTVTIAGTADENITGMQASLSYDTAKLSLENKAAGTGFSDLSGSNEIAIASSGNSEVKSGTLYTLTFKVLDTAELGTATINVSGITLALVDGNQAQSNVTATNTSATVEIISDTTTVDGNSTATTPSITDSESNSSTSSSSSNSQSSSSSTNSASSSSSNSSSKKLPQTGAEVGSIIGIAALSIVAVISYVSYIKYKNI